MKRTWYALTLAIPLGAATAQQTTVISAGSRVRVTTLSTSVVGTLESLHDSTIVIHPPNGTSVALPLADAEVDVSTGPGVCSSDRRGKCVIVGMLLGAAVGLGIGKTVESQCDFCGGKVYPYTLMGGWALGTVVGMLVGGEHWRRVTLPADVSFVLTPGASNHVVRVAMSIRF